MLIQFQIYEGEVNSRGEMNGKGKLILFRQQERREA